MSRTRNQGAFRPSTVSRREFVNKATAATTACAVAAGLVPVSAKAAEPVWGSIPDQEWEVGQSVFLDLSEFVVDPDGDPLIFELDLALPPGVSLSGSIISGIPSTDFATTQYVASADDGPAAPAPPTDVRVE